MLLLSLHLCHDDFGVGQQGFDLLPDSAIKIVGSNPPVVTPDRADAIPGAAPVVADLVDIPIMPADVGGAN
jgi:hypothetical protein